MAKSSELYEPKPVHTKMLQLLLAEWQTHHDESSHQTDAAALANAADDDEEGWEDDFEANAQSAQRDARRMAFMDDLLDLELDDELGDDPPYIAPAQALPAFAPIAELDRFAHLTAFFQQCAQAPWLAAVAPTLSASDQASLSAACYAPR